MGDYKLFIGSQKESDIIISGNTDRDAIKKAKDKLKILRVYLDPGEKRLIAFDIYTKTFRFKDIFYYVYKPVIWYGYYKWTQPKNG